MGLTQTREREPTRGVRGLVQTWGGPLFFMQAQKGGSNNLVHAIKGGHYFLCKVAGVRETI